MAQQGAPAALVRHAGLGGLAGGGDPLCQPSTSGRGGGAGGLLLEGGCLGGQQQRRFLNFAGLNGDVSKTYSERKLIGWVIAGAGGPAWAGGRAGGWEVGGWVGLDG